MKELNFIKTITKTLSKRDYIGDDCAYLKDFGIVVTQDSLVENVHFSMKYCNAYQLGYKSIAVNLSDIYASGAKPKYVTISLSLPSCIDDLFIENFYKACDDLSKEHDFEVVGGDITGGDKIFVSVCAIGDARKGKISSRKNAKAGQKIILTGEHGASSAGLYALLNNIEGYDDFKDTHLMPRAQKDFSLFVSDNINYEYAMMDTSDGLADALFKVAEASNVSMEVDFNLIPYDAKIQEIAAKCKKSLEDFVLFGGEDYQILACLDEKILEKYPHPYYVIGDVVDKHSDFIVRVNNLNSRSLYINNLDKTFNHFGGKNEI